MGLFDFFRKWIPEREAEEDQEDFSDFTADLFDSLSEKCEDGEAIERLNEQERTVYVALLLEAEVNNGGFEQFFYNSSGEFAGELVSAFTRIHAPKTAEICRRALAAFGTEIPLDREEREELLERLEGEEFDEILEECDDAFYEYEEDLARLCHEFVVSNRDFFE